MVRKRTRTARKHYDSDENDSDSDFSLDDLPKEPVQKKYSLRQRKRPLFTEDFDYDDDGEEIEPPKVSSDDEDFAVEQELELDEAPDTEYVDKTTYINHYEPETDDIPEDAEGLIDFEDMIRADIVVNKNRIDYDNIIQKTEIKVQPIEEIQTPPVKSKRGRKPKNRPAEEIDSSILEPETEVQEEVNYGDKNDEDYNPNSDLDTKEHTEPTQTVQTEIKESTTENLSNIDSTTVNGTKLLEDKEMEPTKIPVEEHALEEENISPNNTSEEKNISQECVIKPDENISKEIIDVNGKLPSNDLNEPNEKLSGRTKHGIKKVITGNDDDDVVLVEEEKKCEVIVLDD